MLQHKPVQWSTIAAAAVIAILVVGFWPNKPSEQAGPLPPQGIAWADAIKNVEDASNIHVIHTTRLGKQTVTAEVWLSKPNKYRLEVADQCIIDDGRKRLTIDKTKRTAKWTESPLPYGSREADGITSMVDMLRSWQQSGAEQKGAQLKKIDEESTNGRLVYIASAPNTPGSTKIWVRAGSLFTEKLETSDPSTDRSMQATFSYDPIPDSVFAMSVPDGYTETAIPKRGAISGRVLDADNKPIAKANVYLATTFYHDQGHTNELGEFVIELPPEGSPHHELSLPTFLRAFNPDDPDHVAWTILRAPNDHDLLGGEIPGDPGKVEMAQNQGSASCVSASGIVLKMEPATSIGGLISDSDGKPIAKAEVRLSYVVLRDEEANPTLNGISKLGGPGKDGTPLATTDANGRYRLTNLPALWPSSYLDVCASAPGYVSRERRLTIGEERSKDDVNLELFPARVAIAGKVVDDHGVPLAGRSVQALVNGERMRTCYATTNHNGEFELRNCPASEGLQVQAELCRDPAPHLKNVPEPWYYLDVVQDIKLVPNKTQYKVTLTAKRPDVTLNITVKNSAGQSLPHFPVVIDARDIPTGWSYTKFFARTDAQGRCTFKHVPRADDLHVEIHAGAHSWNEQLSEEARRVADSYTARYRLLDVPVGLVPDKDTYAIEATVITHEEYKARTRR